ncbi:hypothetical protein BsWGS_26668 [Bradybaena similaris]
MQKCVIPVVHKHIWTITCLPQRPHSKHSHACTHTNACLFLFQIHNLTTHMDLSIAVLYQSAIYLDFSISLSSESFHCLFRPLHQQFCWIIPVPVGFFTSLSCGSVNHQQIYPPLPRNASAYFGNHCGRRRGLEKVSFKCKKQYLKSPAI